MADRNYVSANAENIQIDIVAGAAADTDIAIANIKTTDQLKAVIESAVSTAVLTDRFSTTTITSDGNIQCSVATDTDTLIVIWRKMTVDA